MASALIITPPNCFAILRAKADLPLAVAPATKIGRVSLNDEISASAGIITFFPLLLVWR